MTVRSVRNNNPGNLNAGSPWQGLMQRSEMTPEQAAETRFAVFKDAHFGFRALALTLINYQRIHGLNTITGIISRWAPSGENDTAAYIVFVSKDVGFPTDQPIDLSSMLFLSRLAKAIACREAGGWYFQAADLLSGVRAALGLSPEPLVA